MGEFQVNASARDVRDAGPISCGSHGMTAAERLAAGFSHKVNNYLTGIITLTELSLMKLKPEDQVYTHLEKSLKLAWKAVDLTGSVALFAGKHQGQAMPVDINSLVSWSVSGMKGILPDSITIDTELDPDAPRVLTIASLMEIAIRNIVINAAEAMPTGGMVNIATRCIRNSRSRVRAKCAFVELSISDTGTGMTDEVMLKMFEPFFTTKDTGGGSGLGLSIVHGAIRQCGAKLGIRSARDMGTTVTITIPACMASGE